MSGARPPLSWDDRAASPLSRGVPWPSLGGLSPCRLDHVTATATILLSLPTALRMKMTRPTPPARSHSRLPLPTSPRRSQPTRSPRSGSFSVLPSVIRCPSSRKACPAALGRAAPSPSISRRTEPGVLGPTRMPARAHARATGERWPQERRVAHHEDHTQAAAG